MTTGRAEGTAVDRPDGGGPYLPKLLCDVPSNLAAAPCRPAQPRHSNATSSRTTRTGPRRVLPVLDVAVLRSRHSGQGGAEECGWAEERAWAEECGRAEESSWAEERGWAEAND